MRKLSRVLILLTLALSLSGCMKYVYVPVWTCPAPVIPQKEVLQTSTLSKEADTDSILKALIYDIKYLTSYSDQLLSVLNGYKRKDLQVFPDREMLKP